MPFDYADVSVVVIGIKCGNRTSNTKRCHRSCFCHTITFGLTRETDKPRQGVVANTLRLSRNGAVGLIDGLGLLSRIYWNVSSYLSAANQQEIRDQSHDHDKREFSQVNVQARLIRLNARRHSTLNRVAGTVRKGGRPKAACT